MEDQMAVEIEKESTEITTIDQLAQSLAGHTRFISDEIIMPALKQSKEYKPIIEFFHLPGEDRFFIQRIMEPRRYTKKHEEIKRKKEDDKRRKSQIPRGWHPRPYRNSNE